MYLLLLSPLLFQLSGSAPITGPEAVSGLEQGSLTVQCRYDSGWETHEKWWCRGAGWSSCKILVQTTGSEEEVKKDRVSIRDYQRSCVFTVTMEKLRRDDTDTYWCGIKRTGSDHGVKIEVTIGPATTTAPNTTPTTCTATSATNMFTASVTPGDTTGYQTVTTHHSDGRGDSMKLSVLLPLIFAVLLLLFMAASFLAWRMVKQQKKAAGKSPEQVVQPLESDLCYANLTLQQNGTFPSSSRKKASAKFSPSAQEDQVEVEYITMAPFPKEDISYAALSLGTSDQEPTYSNMGSLITHLPSGSHGEPLEYSTIRKT